jgi:hypothetical protein
MDEEGQAPTYDAEAALGEGAILEKSEIQRILEGIFMQQALALLSPCFKKSQRNASDEGRSSTPAHAVDLCSPSESMPEIVSQRSHADPAPNLEFVWSEISQRTGLCCFNQFKVRHFFTGTVFLPRRTPTIDLLVTRRLAVLTTIMKNFHFNETCTKREIYYRNERFCCAIMFYTP